MIQNKSLIVQTSVQPFELALFFDDILVGKETVLFPVSGQLFLKLEKVLATANCVLSDLTEIIFVSGPGSFTGLRTGLAFVQGFSRGGSVPLSMLSVFDVYVEIHPNSKVLIAYRRTQSDAFMAQINKGKIHFFETPLSIEKIQEKVSESDFVYGNVFEKGVAIEDFIDVVKIHQAVTKKSSMQLVYGDSCYAKSIHS